MIKHKHHTEPLNLNWHSSLGVETRIVIGQGVISKLADILAQLHAGNKVLLVKQPSLFTEQVELLKADLHSQGKRLHLLEIPAGEDSKSLDCLTKIWAALHEMSFGRKDTLVALGGGSVSDVAGFAAATYLRGINLITIPTTLLGQVDAAIGGKTAVNFNHTKNMIGTFYFAKAIIVDINTLSTLPADQFISGWAEIIKHALLEKTIAAETEYVPGPKPLLSIVEDMSRDLRWDNILLPGIIAANIKLKLAVVAQDPLETGLRRSLNLGHTLGHALEAASNFELSHGQAVAIGMAFAFRIAVSRSLISQRQEEEVLSLIKSSGLPTKIPAGISSEKLLAFMFHDKKKEGDGIKMVLPQNKLGEVSYNDLIKRQEIEHALPSIFNPNQAIV